MKKILFVLCALLFAASASAQTATPANHIAWDEIGQTAAVASTATFNYYIDTATAAVQVTGVTCQSGTTDGHTAGDAACIGNLPSLTPGQHTITMTELLAGAESPKSTPILFSYVVVITPSGLKIVDVIVSQDIATD